MAKILKQGSKGQDVIQLQKILGIDQTGIFDKQTKTAVLKFQVSKGLLDDAIVGDKTWAALIPPVPAQDSSIGDKIISIAHEYVGLHEVSSNAVWSDKKLSDDLNKMLSSVGWQKGWPYCMAFVEAIWTKAYQGNPKLDLVRSNMNPSVMSSFNNFKALKLTSGKDAIPSKGAVVFFQLGNGGNGHAALVINANTWRLLTIEANTSPEASTAEEDRNGDGIYQKTRIRSKFQSNSGLHIVGFLNPI